MKIFKFGGASIENIERAKNVASIIDEYGGKELVVIISAKGKTTNKLEEIVQAFYQNKTDEATGLLEDLEQEHLQYAEMLLGIKNENLEQKLKEHFTEIEWIIKEKPEREFNYYYDQIVSLGELLSTLIMSFYLHQIKIENEWLDVRDLLRTDANFRDANVDWEYSEKKIIERVKPIMQSKKIIITQGYIGSTSDNVSTTLGREGSDFSAAIFASSLNAQDITIWKDVPALLNADPKFFSDTVEIRDISYREVIEMAFYGAQVIHPKTIKPLYAKEIPLFVKCFLNPVLPGTKISKQQDYRQYPPMMVWKKNQVLVELSTLDFSFINEGNLSDIYEIFHHHKVKMNIIQNAAIAFATCIDYDMDKIAPLIHELSRSYKVKHSMQTDLLTVRHYDENAEKLIPEGKNILLKQQTRTTLKYVIN